MYTEVIINMLAPETIGDPKLVKVIKTATIPLRSGTHQRSVWYTFPNTGVASIAAACMHDNWCTSGNSAPLAIGAAMSDMNWVQVRVLGTCSYMRRERLAMDVKFESIHRAALEYNTWPVQILHQELYAQSFMHNVLQTAFLDVNRGHCLCEYSLL